MNFAEFELAVALEISFKRIRRASNTLARRSLVALLALGPRIESRVDPRTREEAISENDASESERTD